MLTVNFERKDFNGAAALPAVELEVERLEWRAVGGPWTARVRAQSRSLERLWGLADLLRCGMLVSDEEAAAWWGYVSAVEIHHGASVVRVSLEAMVNKVKVVYYDDSPSEASGEENITGWFSDAESVRAWGSKELNIAMGKGTATDAAAYAQSVLAERGQPVVSARVEPLYTQQPAAPFAVIEGRGWWETLDWEYYAQARGQAGNLHGGASFHFGTNAVQKISQRFVTAGGDWYMSEAWIRVKNNLAADDLVVEVCADSAGAPGTVLADGTIAAAALEDEFTWVKVTLSDKVLVSTSTRHLVLRRSGSLSDTAYYTASVDQALNYPGGSLIYHNGTTWFYRSPDADLSFLGVGVEDTGMQVKEMVEHGQFISGCRLDALSAIEGRLHRDGTKRAREEAEKLLKIGQSNGTENLALVERNRHVRVHPKPDKTAIQYQVGKRGELLLPDGRLAPASRQPAGAWARLGETGGAGALMGADSAVWISGVVWENGRLSIRD